MSNKKIHYEKSYENKNIDFLKIQELIQNLRNHDISTYKHSLSVAQDVEYIAKTLGYSKEKIISLKIAALLHDIGKLKIYSLILNLGDKNFLHKVWHSKYNHNYSKNKRLIEQLTIQDIIDYTKKQSTSPEQTQKNFDDFLKQEKLEQNIKNYTIFEYLKLHQNFTKQILTQNKFDDEIIFYAATHHPNYFTKQEKRKLPLECKIIEIVDIFNAISQINETRNYSKKKSKLEAINELINLIIKRKGKLENFLHPCDFERTIIFILIKKYFLKEIYFEISSNITKLKNFNSKNVIDKKNIEEAIYIKNYIKSYQNIFKILFNKQFNDPKLNELRNQFLHYYEFFTENIVYIEEIEKKYTFN